MLLNFAKSFLIHMRPYLFFVSGVAGLAGMAVARVGVSDLPLWAMIFISCFLGYGFGQALTDCFQMDTDAISAPYRPLVRGEVTRRAVGTVSMAGLILIVLVLFFANPWNLALGCLSIVGLITYTWVKKNLWFASPFYNAWIVMLLPVVGFLSTTRAPITEIFEPPLLLCCGLTLFSYANFVLIGYLKDITADRETAYRTFPVVFNWDKTVFAGDGLALVAVLLLFACLSTSPSSGPTAWVLAVAGTLVALSGQCRAHFTDNKSESGAAFSIAATVRSFILWHLAVVIAYEPSWMLFCVLFYIAFEATFLSRPVKHQI